MSTTTAQSPSSQTRTKCTYEGEITSPTDGTEVAFDQDVTVTGRATKSCDDGTSSDATADIRWREYAPHSYRAAGSSVTIKFRSRKNARVALYVKSEDLDAIGLKIVCDAIDPKSAPSNDQLALALIMFTEGRSCTEAEKEAIGACVINRLLYPATFGSSLRGVIEQPGQFQAVNYRIYSNSVDDPDYIRSKFTYEECTEFKPVIQLAAGLLFRSGPITPGGFTGAPFYFNQSTQATGPAGTRSPRVHLKGDDGFKHSFYGYTG